MQSHSSYHLKILLGTTVEQAFRLTSQTLIIGRGEGSDIVITSPQVSRNHARLTLIKGGYSIEDLGSANGTKLNGKEIRGKEFLKPGDRIVLGNAVVLEYDVHQPSGVRQPAFPSTTSLDQAQAQQAQAPMGPGPPPTPTDIPKTTYYDEQETFISQQPTFPSQIVVAVTGAGLQTYNLNQPRIMIGRDSSNDITIDSSIISRSHAQLDRIDGGYQLTILESATNPTYLDGRLISGTHPLQHNNIIRVGSEEIGEMVTMTYLSPSDLAKKRATSIKFGTRPKIQIGRHPENDIVLSAPTVSGYHAQIERVGQRFRLMDLNSSNGTFITTNVSRMKFGSILRMSFELDLTDLLSARKNLPNLMKPAV